MSVSSEFTAKDSAGHLLQEYDLVAMTRATVFFRHDHVGSTAAKICTHVVPKGGEARIISISELEQSGMNFSILELESNDGVFFCFELPENVIATHQLEERG